MNKHFYRVIFSRVKGMLLVVAEIAGGHSTTGGRRTKGAASTISQLAKVHPCWWQVVTALGLVSLLLPAQATTIRVDDSAAQQQRPTVTESANGSVQINIQTPNGRGLSHNKYRQFDVSNKGVILNNSHPSSLTEQAGYINGNEFLAKTGAAKIILNEVNSRDPSKLNGYIEVAGQKAQVVIANAAGITCDGCGFINAGRATLTTGEPLIKNGQLTGYQVRQGAIAIEGQGLDSRRPDYTDIIARTVAVNAEVHAKSLSVVTGQNHVSHDTQQIKAIAEDKANAQQVALDVSALGGMYAGKIRLIGTEGGVGVRNYGQLGASAGSIVINSQGKIENHAQMQAASNIELTSQQTVSNHKQIYAKGQLSIEAKQTIANQGTMVAGHDLSLTSQRVTNQKQAVIAAGIDKQGKLTEQGQLNIKAQSATLQGQQLAGGHLTIRTQDQLTMTGSQTQAGQLTLQSGELNTDKAVIQLKGNATITSQDWSHQQASLASDGQLTVKAQQINHRDSTLLANGLKLEAQALSGDGDILSTGDMQIKVQQSVTNQGRILAEGKLKLDTDKQLINQQKIMANKGLSVTAETLTNQAGAEINSGNTRLTIGKHLTNRGLIDGSQVVIHTGQLDNLGTGRLYGDAIWIGAQRLNNLAEGDKAAVIAARRSLALGVERLDNRDHAEIRSLGELTIGGHLTPDNQITGRAQQLNNHSAKIEAGSDMRLNVAQLNNINGNLQTELVKTGEAKFHTYCHVGSTKCYDAKEVRFHHVGGRNNYLDLITPDGRSHYDFHEYQYTESYYETQITHSEPGEIIAGGNLTIRGDNVENHDSKLIAGQKLTIDAALNNVSTEGIQKTVSQGKHIYHYRYQSGGGSGRKRYYQDRYIQNYHPADKIEVIDLQAGKVVEKAQVTASQAPDKSQPTQVGSISTIQPNVTLPSSSLHQINKRPDSHHLIETDPRFTDRKQWLGSDYLLTQLKQDPNNVQKRLGDGYYEQQHIREQITALTGQRNLPGYGNDMAQYKQLMDNAVKLAEQYQFKIGVALTSEQMQALTTDIVWLVSQKIKLDDGSEHEVLVPQLYLVNRPQVASGGALIAGQAVNIHSDSTLVNAGVISAQQGMGLTAHHILNKGLLQGNTLALDAMQSITSHGAMRGNQGVQLKAGEDIHLISTTRTQQNHSTGHNLQTNIDRVSVIQSTQGDITLNAGRDIHANAAHLANHSDKGNIVLNAGNNLTLGTVEIRDKQQNILDSDNYRKTDIRQQMGSEISAKGNIQLSAGKQLTTQGASITTDNQLNLRAQDIHITSATNREQLSANSKVTSKGLFSKSTTLTHNEVDDQWQSGSTLVGGTINIQADNHLQVSGSQVVSRQDTALKAGGDITIDAAKEQYYNEQHKQTQKSGLMSSGGIGFTIGSLNEQQKTKQTDIEYLGSTIGSTQGSVTIESGNTTTVRGSEIIAKQDINLTASEVNIQSVDSRSHYQEHYEREKTGLTIAVTGTVAELYEAAQAVKQARERGNREIAALNEIKAGLTGMSAAMDRLGSMDEVNATNTSGSIGVSAMVGTERSEREVNEAHHQVHSAGVSAGNNIHIKATGKQTGQGNIQVTGSTIQAGNDIHLKANNDIQLIGDVNTQHRDSDERQISASVGVGVSLGKETNFAIKGKGSFSRERENQDGSAWTESLIKADQKLSIETGHDMTVKGAQLKGERIKADIGHNLNIESLQDSDDYDYDKLKGTVSGSYGFGSGGISADIGLAKTKMESEWASVTDQSGIFAGKEGFDIKVGNHTDLKGAVIAAEGEKDKNRLETGNISFSDIENKADYKVKHDAINAGTSGVSGSRYRSSGNASSTTQSAVEQGELIINNGDAQKQDIKQLSRDTANAHHALGTIFDKEKQQTNIDKTELISEIAKQGQQVADKVGRAYTQHQIKQQGGPSQEDLEQARQQLPADASEQHIAEKAMDIAINRQSQTGMGSQVNKAIDAVSAIVSGIISGNITGGVAGALAPDIATLIKQHTGHRDPETGEWQTDPLSNTLAHALLGGVVAQLQGGNALAGATGAAVGENAANIISHILYPNKAAHELSPDEKEKVSGIASIAGAMAGSIAGGGEGIADAVTGGLASKNAVENNALSWGDGGMDLPIPVAPTTGDNMDSILHANNLTREEAEQALKNLVKGKGISTGSNEIIMIYSAPGVISGAVAIVVEAGIASIVGGTMISLGANGGYQLVSKPANEFSFIDVGIAGGVGAITAGQGWTGTILWNAVGGASSSVISGEHPLIGAISGGIGGATGKVTSDIIGPIGGSIMAEIGIDKTKGVINNKYGEEQQ
jgi:filamentous hemagglutinin